MDLNYEYESSFKNFIFLTLPKKKKMIWFFLTESFILRFTKNRSNFSYSNLSFYPLQKTDMIFLNKIIFFFLPFTNNRFDFYQSNLKSLYFFFITFQNRYDFSLKRRHIHKPNLFKLIFSNCLSCVLQNIIQHHTKGYIMVM